MKEEEIIAIYLLGYEEGSCNLPSQPNIEHILEHLKAFINETSN